MRSDSATSGSASWARVKLVCMDLEARDHAPGVQNALGIEAILHPLGQCRHRAVLRLEHRRRRAQLQRRADQRGVRSEEHTSELQSLMRTPYAVFCLENKHTTTPQQNSTNTLTESL